MSIRVIFTESSLRFCKVVVLMVILFFIYHSNVEADKLRLEEKQESRRASYKLASDLPNAQQRVHRVGLMHLCVTNWGFFGSEARDLNESQGGCFNPHPDEELPAPSCEYPANSDVEYLFQGGLWIGAKVDDYPYTTVGCDGWLWINEMWSDAGEEGAIKERSIRPNSPCYSPDAVSEQDIIAVYSDTSADIPLSPWKPEEVDFDNRKHFPLGLQITQKSYSWSYEYAEDFVLIDFILKNIGVRRIQDMFMGLYLDADVMHIDENTGGPFGPQDDICGFKHMVTDTGVALDCADTVNLAWIADNDGHGIRGELIFTPVSPIAVTGTRVVRSPKPGLQYSFNWWISNQTGYPKDWGPWTRESWDAWALQNPYDPGSANFPDDVLGTPGGDCSKYFIMSNQEFDYDQIFSCSWPDEHPEEGWLDPSPECDDLANGYDTRYLLSFGPFEQIAPGESLIITVGYIAGADFHVDPLNLHNDPNMTDPEAYYANLDFSDLETNAVWAAKVFDNPELPDFPCGDGIPDFKGPPPPPSPTLNFETRKGRVKVKWNGKSTEKSRDSFNNRLDFEGYRVYMSRTGLVEDYALLGSYDRIDYKIYKLNRYKEGRPWEWRAASVSLDSLQSWLEKKGLEPMGDDPTQFTRNNPFVIKETSRPFYLRLSDLIDPDLGYAVAYDSIKLESFDSLYFEAQDWNMGFGDILIYPEYRDSVDQGLLQDTLDRYWDYQFEVEVFASQPIWFAVSAFDVGDPQTGLPPLEASKLVNTTLVYPIDDVETVEEENLKVMVYPNPYRIDAEYSASGYEPGGSYGKRIRFVNLPPRCTIRIYTLDGDLVREIDHHKDELDLDATYDDWDLISRNTQAVVSGIYLYSVENKDTGDTQIGKFVIIK
jgi:hypothetical protein